MGLWLSRIASLFGGDQEARILVLGLDNAGKTTILCKRRMGGWRVWRRDLERDRGGGERWATPASRLRPAPPTLLSSPDRLQVGEVVSTTFRSPGT